MRKISVFAVMLLAVLFSSTPRAAHAQDVQDFQTWSALLGGAKLDNLTPGARLWFDGHVRRGDAGTVLLLRPGLGYQFASWGSAWVGYAWVPVFVDVVSSRIDEQRVWQQLVLSGSWLNGQLKAQSRTRLEQRFSELSDTVGHRVRQFVRADYRFEKTVFAAVVWDELFWGLNDAGFAASGFDQNRVFVGPAIHAMDGLRLEAGYLNVVLHRQNRWQMQHVLALNFFVSL